MWLNHIIPAGVQSNNGGFDMAAPAPEAMILSSEGPRSSLHDGAAKELRPLD